ncbi:zinc finger MYND domain-containing protein 15 isoform X2 [Dendrobates tinctorius]|uniref:zinc finger MYND domain-containing protein 15 isoform X2 n=1 Tax=Dendrobates tinctorius TaxID=92724 RepID=UPI003CC9D77F
MDFVSGYRDPIVEYSELLFSWYRQYRKEYDGRLDRLGSHPQREVKIKALPYGASCWFLHVLYNDSIAFRPRNTELQIRDRFYVEDALHFQDLKKYISLINLHKETEDNTGPGDASAEPSDDVRHIKYLLIVAEDTGTVLGIDFLMDIECRSNMEQYMCKLRSYHLLCQCMALPMDDGQPRRPQSVTIGEPSVHRFLVKNLHSLGVGVQKRPMEDWTPIANFSFSAQTVRYCHVCKKRSFEVTLNPCDTCGAILYCSEKCRRQNWKKCPQELSHEFWCVKMKLFMQDEERLADLPFYFTKEVTSRTFNKELFLSGHKLSGGYWAVESIHYHPSCLQDESLAWNLEEKGEPLLKNMELIPRQQPKDKLKSSLVPEVNILKKRSLKIHILEAIDEYRNVLLFWELVVLMPQVVLELVFFGTDLPMEEDERSFIIYKKGSEVVCSDITYVDNHRGVRGIHIKVHARPYHVLQVAKPDLVIGFNSGFGLDDTWLSTLPRLQAMKVPAYFSDCSRYSCDVDGQVVAAAMGGSVSAPSINPFRSPLRSAATDNNLPWYKNAFLFYLIYKYHHGVTMKRNNNHAPYSTVQIATPEIVAEASPQKKKDKPGRNRCRKRK